MGFDRGMLARIDRKVLSGLGHDERWQTVRLPVSEATWSTWRRYCDAAGISMGRAIVKLVESELHAVVEETSGGGAVLAGLVAAESAARETRLAAREGDVEATEERLRGWTVQLGKWEAELETLDQRVRLASSLAARPRETGPKVGRNERCPCGSGFKYKHCHATTDR